MGDWNGLPVANDRQAAFCRRARMNRPADSPGAGGTRELMNKILRLFLLDYPRAVHTTVIGELILAFIFLTPHRGRAQRRTVGRAQHPIQVTETGRGLIVRCRSDWNVAAGAPDRR